MTTKTESAKGEAAAVGDDDLAGCERFYPEVSKAHRKWVKTAGENPIIMANASFETYLAGWQAAEKKYLRQPSPALGGVGDVERVAIAIEPRAFLGTEESRHMFASPRSLGFVQDEILHKARAAIAAMHTTDAPLLQKDKI